MAASRRKQETLALAAGTVNPAGSLTYDQLSRRDLPTDLNAIFTRARLLADQSTFLTAYLPLKLSFYNHGFQIGMGDDAKGDNTALTKWLDTELKTDVEYTDPLTQLTIKIQLNATVREGINKLVGDVWKEFLLLDNCVGFWLDQGGTPFTLPPEKCVFTDKFGLPILKYIHGLSRQEILLLPQEQQARFSANTTLLLDADQGEHFKVLKRGVQGAGFGKPSLLSMFRTLGEIESKEIGFNGRAFLLRAATRQHKLGHEIKNGLHAGKGTWFWNQKRSDKVLTTFKDRQGPHDYTSNFDDEIVFPWPAVADFDDVAWKGTDRRMRNWGGPVAQMLLSEKIVEGGLAFLRAQVVEDRRAVAEFITPIIRAAFKAPDALNFRLSWSELIFLDPTKAAELLKFAVAQGLCSATTATEQLGYNSTHEQTQKVKEADDADAAKKFRPMWDTSHGIAPATGETAASLAAKGADPQSTNGRPAGSATGGGT